MRENNEYYYQLLSKEEKRAYDQIRTGLLELKDSISVERIDPARLSEIYFLIRMDHPEIFYSLTYKYRYSQNSSFYELIPEYIFTKDKIREHRKALDARLKKLIRPFREESEICKELFVHDFLCENVKYDKLKKEYSHEIIGALENGTAVCEGIAKGAKMLLDALNVWNIVVLSEANPDKGIKYRHCWNLIKLDEKYYHLDITFDNTISRKTCLRHDYMNLGDKQIFRDHEPSIYRIPNCDDYDRFYYRQEKLSWTKTEDVRNRASQAIRKNRPLLFHWRGGYLTKEVLSELLELLEEEAEKKEKRAVVSLNYAQAVLYAEFSDREASVQFEEVNEGEESPITQC